MNTTTTIPKPAAGKSLGSTGPRRVLCAYSPRWLSGPTPGYRGLCPTWQSDEPTADAAALPTD